jgi:pyridoxine 5-phosphate synthase
MAAEYAHAKGLVINAGHGLDYDNVKRIVTIPHLHELNIGFSIISRALFAGLGQAVKEMKRLLSA